MREAAAVRSFLHLLPALLPLAIALLLLVTTLAGQWAWPT